VADRKKSISGSFKKFKEANIKYLPAFFSPEDSTIKLFTAVIYRFSVISQSVFVSGQPFQPSLMFVGEARSLP
jgi:hypothetical protein